MSDRREDRADLGRLTVTGFDANLEQTPDVKLTGVTRLHLARICERGIDAKATRPTPWCAMQQPCARGAADERGTS